MVVRQTATTISSTKFYLPFFYFLTPLASEVIPDLDLPNPLDGQINVELEDTFSESADDKRSMRYMVFSMIRRSKSFTAMI